MQDLGTSSQYGDIVFDADIELHDMVIDHQMDVNALPAEDLTSQSFLDDSMNDGLFSITPWPRKIHATGSLSTRHKHFTKATQGDPDHILWNTTVRKEAERVAKANADQFGENLTLNDWEQVFWMQQSDILNEEQWKLIWRNEYVLVVCALKHHFHLPPPTYFFHLGLPCPPSWIQRQPCVVCTYIL